MKKEIRIIYLNYFKKRTPFYKDIAKIMSGCLRRYETDFVNTYQFLTEHAQVRQVLYDN